MGGLSVSIPKGTGNGSGTGKTPSPGGERTAAAKNSLISFLASSLSAMVEDDTGLRHESRRRERIRYPFMDDLLDSILWEAGIVILLINLMMNLVKSMIKSNRFL